jgi:hypothetical protein
MGFLPEDQWDYSPEAKCDEQINPPELDHQKLIDILCQLQTIKDSYELCITKNVITDSTPFTLDQYEEAWKNEIKDYSAIDIILSMDQMYNEALADQALEIEALQYDKLKLSKLLTVLVIEHQRVLEPQEVKKVNWFSKFF